jgi:hypothetical protein
MKIKTSQINIVCHPNMHTCAQYGIVWTNYVVVVAITIWFGLKATKLHTRYLFFVNTFSQYLNIQSLLFFIETRSHNMAQREAFVLFWFCLNFLCWFQNVAKMVGVTAPRSGSNPAKIFMDQWWNIYFCTQKWFLEKNMSKLWSTCSSNLTHFQLNW